MKICAQAHSAQLRTAFPSLVERENRQNRTQDIFWGRTYLYTAPLKMARSVFEEVQLGFILVIKDLTPMQRCVRRDGTWWCSCSDWAGSIFKFRPDISAAEIKELGQGLLRVRVCNRLNQLVDGSHSIWSNVGASVVKNHVKHHVIQRFRKMDENLATCSGYCVY